MRRVLFGMAGGSNSDVRISVVIPTLNSSAELRLCLGALRANTVRPYEIIVVDDGSTENVAAVAKRFGAQIFATGGPHGPAVARNLGAANATGDVLFFIDVDVMVKADTIARLTAEFSDPEVHAVIGSYDSTPAAPQLLSQYRNLMHHYTHQNGSRQAATFWSGCGAVRRSIFLSVNGFDASYLKPAIEDIELGYRLTSAGYRIVLDRKLQVKHLKRWTLTNIVRTDVVDRGIPWTRLILRAGRMPNDLNIRWTQRLSVALVALALLLGLISTFQDRGRFVTPFAGTILLAIGSFWTSEAMVAGTTAIRVALALSIGIFGVLAWLHDLYAAMALILGGYAFLFIREWMGHRDRRWKRILGLLYGAYLVPALGYMILQIPHSPFVLGGAALLGMNLLLNARFYAFLCSRVGGLCAVALIPFHLLFYIYSGFSFVIGAVQHFSERQLARLRASM